MDKSTRKTIVSTLFFVAVCVPLQLCAHKHEEFLKANQLYEQGDYNKALHIYESLENKGYGVYFNMGNAHYKKGNYTAALISWKKAQRLARGAQLRATFENIKKVEKKLSMPASTLSDEVVSVLGPYVSHAPMIVMQFIWLLFAFGIVMSCLRQSGHKRVLIIVALIMGLAGVGGILAIKRSIQLPHCAVIMDKNACMFAGPNNKYHHVASIAMGNQVSICQQGNDWCKITFGNHVGWMPSSALDII